MKKECLIIYKEDELSFISNVTKQKDRGFVLFDFHASLIKWKSLNNYFCINNKGKSMILKEKERYKHATAGI